MDTVELLSKFADPEVMKNLPIMERMIAGLITTVLGMGITFISLIVLQFAIGLMARFTSVKVEKAEKVGAPAVIEVAAATVDKGKDEEIVAAITTALAIQLKTSVSNIVIRNIEKVEESSTAWHKAGIAEHMNNSL
jgi:sodium pump decarboxylase gamma subunit